MLNIELEFYHLAVQHIASFSKFPFFFVYNVIENKSLFINVCDVLADRQRCITCNLNVNNMPLCTQGTNFAHSSNM